MSDHARVWINNRTEAAKQSFRDAVLPIYGATDIGQPVHIGSSTLIELNEGFFLVTAAHVIDENKYTTLYLGYRSLIELEFVAFVSAPPGSDRNKDHFDCAFAKLSDEQVSELRGAKFITEDEIHGSVFPTEKRAFICLGYPNSRNKVSRDNANRVASALGSYLGMGRAASNLQGKATDAHHILVSHDTKKARDGDGSVLTPYQLRGFSGGAIIDVGNPLCSDLPKLAALLIEKHHREKVILGTRIKTILDAIRVSFPKK